MDSAQSFSPQVYQARHMRAFLAWITPIVFSFALLGGLAWFFLDQPASGLTSIVILGYVILLIIARWRLDHGQLQLAVNITWGGILVADILIEFIQPKLFPTLAIIPLLAVAIALPYTNGPHLRQLIGICWCAILIIATIGALDQQHPSISAWFDAIFLISSMSAASTLVLFLLWQFKTHLMETINQIQAINIMLRENEERYRVVTETASDGIVTIDSASTIQFANRAVADMFGYSQTELIGQSMTLLMPIAQYHPHMNGIQHYLITNQRRLSWKHIIFTGKHKLGHDIPLELSYGEFWHGDQRFFTGILRDITERLQAEQQRRFLEQQLSETRKHESLSAMAGGIAHDFNNLLTVIIGNTELILADPTHSPPHYEMLTEIRGASQRAASLTQQMLAYSGKNQFLIQAINVNALLKELTDLLPESTYTKVQVELFCLPNLPYFKADPIQIRQLIMILLSNAIEAVECPLGRITITTNHCMIDQHYSEAVYAIPYLTAGEYMTISIADTGSGIDQTILPRLFDPFFTTKFVGRGLGLSVALGIVRGYEGGLQVESSPDQGATFTILLPYKYSIGSNV